eukprot:1626220-Alexandrium_andersonii.AAC.1
MASAAARASADAAFGQSSTCAATAAALSQRCPCFAQMTARAQARAGRYHPHHRGRRRARLGPGGQ